MTFLEASDLIDRLRALGLNGRIKPTQRFGEDVVFWVWWNTEVGSAVHISTVEAADRWLNQVRPRPGGLPREAIVVKTVEDYVRPYHTDSQVQEITRFVESLPEMTDDQLVGGVEQYVWLSAYASNNPRSAYHPKCDAAYDECVRRGKPELYDQGHKR